MHSCVTRRGNERRSHWCSECQVRAVSREKKEYERQHARQTDIERETLEFILDRVQVNPIDFSSLNEETTSSGVRIKPLLDVNIGHCTTINDGNNNNNEYQ